ERRWSGHSGISPGSGSSGRTRRARRSERAPMLANGPAVGHNGRGRSPGRDRAVVLPADEVVGEDASSSAAGRFWVSVRGVLHVHCAPPALCPHIEWAVAGVLGVPVSMPWVDQPASPGAMRAELQWNGNPGAGGAITSALASWNLVR